MLEMTMNNLDELRAQMGVQDLQIIPFDASTRRYYRSEKGVFMVDKAEGAALRLSNFVDVAKRLRKAKLHAPEIYEVDIENGILLIEDFGVNSLKIQNSDANLRKAFALLEPIRKVEFEGLKDYSVAIYSEEISRLMRFYLRPLGIMDAEILDLAAPILEELEAKNSVFVHLDFHPENLMILHDETIGLLDFQDARYGHPLYDLASYFDGVRLKMPEAFRAHAEAQLTRQDYHDYRMIAAQRLLKIVGIFARMIGEGHEKYSALMPDVFDSLDLQFEYSELRLWREWFNDVVPRPSPEIFEILSVKDEPN